jgi:anaerobic ribonucleoside-triphosphate reductase activating protein
MKGKGRKINVAAICPVSEVLGPGKRFVIWVQGCCFNCINCGSPEWREMKEAKNIAVKDLAERILVTKGIEGITLSGGEPMLQAAALYDLITIVRKLNPISVICYTGFKLDELIDKKDPDIEKLIAVTDVLIDGRYDHSLNNNTGLRGSENQNIHFLSGLYSEQADDFFTCNRKLEIHLGRDHYLLVGIKPKGSVLV